LKGSSMLDPKAIQGTFDKKQLAQIFRHVADYIAAVDAGDVLRAQAGALARGVSISQVAKIDRLDVAIALVQSAASKMEKE